MAVYQSNVFDNPLTISEGNISDNQDSLDETDNIVPEEESSNTQIEYSKTTRRKELEKFLNELNDLERYVIIYTMDEIQKKSFESFYKLLKEISEEELVKLIIEVLWTNQILEDDTKKEIHKNETIQINEQKNECVPENEYVGMIKDIIPIYGTIRAGRRTVNMFKNYMDETTSSEKPNKRDILVSTISTGISLVSDFSLVGKLSSMVILGSKLILAKAVGVKTNERILMKTALKKITEEALKNSVNIIKDDTMKVSVKAIEYALKARLGHI